MRIEKGIVFEAKKTHHIFLTADGRFMKGHPTSDGVEVGQEVWFEPKTIPTFAAVSKKKWMPALGVLLTAALLFFTIFIPGASEVSAYVQVDINPSVELGLNAKGNVLEVTGINEDGKQLVDEISKDIKGHPLEEALSTIIEEVKDEKIEIERVNITSIVVNDKQKPEIEKTISKQISNTVDTAKIEKVVQVEEATTKIREEANKAKQSISTYKKEKEPKAKQPEPKRPETKQPVKPSKKHPVKQPEKPKPTPEKKNGKKDKPNQDKKQEKKQNTNKKNHQNKQQNKNEKNSKQKDQNSGKKEHPDKKNNNENKSNNGNNKGNGNNHGSGKSNGNGHGNGKGNGHN